MFIDSGFRLYTATNKPFKRLCLVKFDGVLKKNLQLSKKLLKYSSLFQLHMCEAKYSSYTSNKPTNCNRLNEEADRTQLSSVEPEIRKTYKYVKQCHSSNNTF